MKILIISSDKALKDVLNFCFDGWGYEVFLWETPVHDITPIKKISPDVIVADVYSAQQNQLHICQLLKDDFTTSFIPIITLINKRQLRSHLLNLKQGVDDYLIKPPDPLDLRVRVEMAIKRSLYSFYATPLTGLPGARLIEDFVNERVQKNIPFSFGYVDIDSFKYFNDVYGYLRGDRVIMQTAYILYRVIKKFGSPADFIGHIGGDDFVFVTAPEKFEEICQRFILMFDKVIPFHYSTQDRKQGFVIARDRAHKLKKLALMSVSIAVVTRKDAVEFKGFVEVNERITEIKRYLKNLPDSKFMADRRSSVKNKGQGPCIYKREETPQNSYRPIGQLLMEKKIISAQQLDDVLKMHWKRGVILGEILKETGFVRDDQLEEVLNVQKSYSQDAGVFV